MKILPVTVQSHVRGHYIQFCEDRDQQYIVVNRLPTSKIEFHPTVGVKVHYTIQEAEHIGAALTKAIEIARHGCAS